MLATESDVSIFLVQRSEETDSPNMVEGDLKAIKCFRKQTGKPLGAIPLIPNVMAGILKNMEAGSLNRLGFEPEHAQCLFKAALSENGPDNVVGIRQAALYAALYWGTAHFEEIVPLQICQLVKKGASFELQICKGKKNQTKSCKGALCILMPRLMPATFARWPSWMLTWLQASNWFLHLETIFSSPILTRSLIYSQVNKFCLLKSLSNP